MCHSDVGNKPLSEEKEEFQTLSEIRVYIFTPTDQDDWKGGPLKTHPNCFTGSLSFKVHSQFERYTPIEKLFPNAYCMGVWLSNFEGSLTRSTLRVYLSNFEDSFTMGVSSTLWPVCGSICSSFKLRGKFYVLQWECCPPCDLPPASATCPSPSPSMRRGNDSCQVLEFRGNSPKSKNQKCYPSPFLSLMQTERYKEDCMYIFRD